MLEKLNTSRMQVYEFTPSPIFPVHHVDEFKITVSLANRNFTTRPYT
jgi:hypothetical protein